MRSVFLFLLTRSVSAGWLILAAVLLRRIFRKAPRRLLCLLWLLVAVRLVSPALVQSPLSILPGSGALVDLTVNAMPALGSDAPVLFTAFPPSAISYVPGSNGEAAGFDVLRLLSAVWLAGAVGMLGYALIGYLRLRKTVAPSMPLEDGVYLCDGIDTPFILGLLRPRVYIPSSMDPSMLPHVLAHERAHLRRLDHVSKAFGYLLLSLYWFSPLCWLAYVLACRDIELACDEHVIRTMDVAGRRSYSEALLALSRPSGHIVLSPLAFGEVGVKARIKSVLNYKKPALWLIVAAVAVCLAAAYGLLAEPVVSARGADASFTAQVLSVDEQTMLVAPAEDTTAAKSASVFSIPVPTDFDAAPGDLILVEYDGLILETFPASVGEVYSIRRVGEVDLAQEALHDPDADWSETAGVPDPQYIKAGLVWEDKMWIYGGRVVSVLYDNGAIYTCDLGGSDADRVYLSVIRSADGVIAELRELTHAEARRILENLPVIEGDGSTLQAVAVTETSDVQQELIALAETFSAAYFGGDLTELRSCLSLSYSGGSGVYSGEPASDIAVKGAQDAVDDRDGAIYPLSVRFRAGDEDSYTYLSLEAVREYGQWKVLSYGLEK